MFLALTYDWAPHPTNFLTATYYIGDLDTPISTSGIANHGSLGSPGGTDADLRIGGTALGSGDRTPYALFDDVRIYNEVLTRAQLEDIRLSSVPEPVSVSLIAIAGAGLLRRRRCGSSITASSSR